MVSFAQNTFPAIGMWREHLPYGSTLDVTASDKKIYAASPYSLLSVDRNSYETERISKVSGLSETGIAATRFDLLSHKLFIAYSNSNIDVIDEKGIHHLADLKRETISGDKNIYHIDPDNSRCYLSTGLGIIVLDALKYEVKETWLIGKAGNYVKCYGFSKNNGFFYAATEEGLKKTSVNANAADYHNWLNLSGNNGLPAAPAKGVMVLSSKTFVLQNDSLFQDNGNSWSLFFANGWPVISASVSENKLLICQRQTNGDSKVVVLNPDGSIMTTLKQPGVISFPKNAISVNNTFWVADLYGGLSHWTGNNFEKFTLNAPGGIVLGGISIANHVLYATAGSVSDAWTYQYNRDGIFRFSDGAWINYNQANHAQLDSLLDFITVAIDPRDASAWAGSYGGSLLHLMKNNQLEIFKQQSPIGATIGDPGSYRVSGLAFDQENNLWLSNFGSSQPLHVLKSNGTWHSFSSPFLLNLNALSQIVIDDTGKKWIVSPKGNGLVFFDDHHTIDNPNDDTWKLLRAGKGQGNLPSSEVLSIAKDKSGYIWVGTSDGVGVVQCAQETFSNGCEAIWPIINEGNFANYLFKGQEVRSIAVDGANRKWMATSSGAWLVSADGDQVLSHFTEDNSPLLSNDIRTIAIDGATGEVFFATVKGLISFRGSATEAGETKNQVMVYPNPVPPAFNGTIGIRGLPENSRVRITETNGRLVYQTVSLGSQATWNGKDYKGHQAASGVYLVMATDETKQEKVVAKIVLIN